MTVLEVGYVRGAFTSPVATFAASTSAPTYSVDAWKVGMALYQILVHPSDILLFYVRNFIGTAKRHLKCMPDAGY